MSEPEIIIQEINRAAIITLNRPKSLNAINDIIIIGLLKALKKFEKEKTLVIIKGTGRAFCAGADIIRMFELFEGNFCNLAVEYCRVLNELLFIIHTYRIPIVTLVNGIAFGGGGGITALSKYAVVTEKAIFSMPEVKFGFHPNSGGSYFLNRSKGKLGIYMGLTGERLKGADIVTAGFASHFCDSSNLQQLEKQLIHCSNRADIEGTIESYCDKKLSPFTLDPVMENINKYFSEPTVEDIIMKLEENESSWAKNTVKAMKKYSPSCLKVIMRQLTVSKDMDLLECLVMESNLTCNFYNFEDIFEGTTALLIDRTRTPKWNPPKLTDVSEELILQYFKTSAGELLRRTLCSRRQELISDVKPKL